MKINPNQLSSQLQNKLAPCYLVTGDEHLLVDEALDSIRAVARERGFTSRDLHVATTGFDWSSLRDAGANLSLFAEKRIVELRVPTGKPGRAGSQAIADFIGNCDDDLLFIVVAPKLHTGLTIDGTNAANSSRDDIWSSITINIAKGQAAIIT